MSKVIYLKPARPGLNVPVVGENTRLPNYGQPVTDSPYWRRRLREKSVLRTTPEDIARERDAFEADLAAQASVATAAEQPAEPAAESAPAADSNAEQPQTAEKASKPKNSKAAKA
ncbi:DUF2635 domain-containing protein [Desulfovibrio sp. OttesenSCG-928-C06]|nr:DUF2635 domain-containing protein [Desulfovibrio sp. OttesenSCG-928-C06]